MKEKLRHLFLVFDLRKFIKFGIIGVLNTLVDFGVFYLMNRWLGEGPRVVWFGAALALGPYISNTASYVIANIHSFLWNKFWTFQKKERITGREAIRYIVTSCGYLLVSTACLAFFINIFHLSPMRSKVPTAFITIFYNYLMNKFWVFR